MSGPLIGQLAPYSPLIGRHLGLTLEWAPTTAHSTTTSSQHSIYTWLSSDPNISRDMESELCRQEWEHCDQWPGNAMWHCVEGRARGGADARIRFPQTFSEYFLEVSRRSLCVMIMSDLITVITHDAMDISHTDIDLFIQKASLQFLLWCYCHYSQFKIKKFDS